MAEPSVCDKQGEHYLMNFCFEHGLPQYESSIGTVVVIFFYQAEDKVRIQQEKLELAQQNLNQSLRKAEALPKIEEELAVQMAALNEVQKSINNGKENLFLL